MSAKADLELIQLKLNNEGDGANGQHGKYPQSTTGSAVAGTPFIPVITPDIVDGLTRRRHPTFKEVSLEGDAAAWAKKKGVNCRRCTRFVEKRGTQSPDPICCCGYQKSKHDVSITTTSSTEAWHPQKDTKCISTDAVGEMEFVGFSQKYAPYVRIDTYTETDVLWEMMTRVWKLKPPHLVISVTGGARFFQLTPRLKEVFRKGLIKAALSTDAWITSGGTYAGVMKYVGEAVRELTLGQSSQNRVVALGIAPWGCVQNKQSLIEPKGLAQYRIEDCKSGGETPLDCNHTHFILVDDGTQHKFAAEISLRARLEKAIAEKSSGDGLTIPIILVVVEGGPGTLETVYSSIENKTPALIIAGSGRAANILAYAFSNATVYKMECTDGEGKQTKKNVLVMPDEIEDGVRQQLQETFKETREEKLTVYVDWIKQCLQDPDLLSVFQLDSHNSAKEIDLAILKGLLKANREHVLDQLRLALIWNRVDVAKSDIFTDDRTWKSGSLNDVMLTAIRLDRVDFVKLFLENGLSLREFLTDETLLQLYNSVPKKSHLYVQLRKMWKNKRPDTTSLRDIGHLIKLLMGDFYAPVYLRQETSKSSRKSIPQDHTGNNNRREHPERDLFLWSVLLDRCDMARVFWEEGKDALPAALVANSLLKSIQHKTEDFEQKEMLGADALEFQQLALGIIKECYEDDEDRAHSLLVRRLDLWGNTNCVTLAIQSVNKEFIAQAACQDLFNEVWWGKLDPSNGYMVMPAALFPPLMFLILRFKTSTGDSEDNEGKQSQPVRQGTSASLLYEESLDVVPLKQISLSPCEKIQAFFVAPVTKFFYNVLFFLAFLLLYSYIMLTRFYYESPSIQEAVLIGWVISMFLEEIRQLWKASPGSLWKRTKNYIDDKWNILDVVTISVFFVGIVLRFLPNRDAFEAARLILAVNLFTFFVRLLHIFSVSKLMGPKLVMIGKMIWDLVSFLLIMVVFIIGYAITSQSILYPNTEFRPAIISEVMRKAYWQMFAELFLEEIEGKDCDPVDDVSLYSSSNYTRYSSANYTRCPSEVGKVMVPILLAFYMLLTNVLLLNLLIAMFSNTFQAIQDNTDLHWHFQRYKLVYEYFERPVLPPPFIIISHLYRFFQLCRRCEVRVSYGFLSGMDDPPDDGKRLDLFEDDRREEFVWQRNKRRMETTDHKVSITADRMETLIAKVDDLQGHILSSTARGGSLGNLDGQPTVEESISDIQDRVGSLENQITRTYEALEWVISALSDNNLIPKEVKRPLYRTSVKADDVGRGPSHKKASSKKRLKRQSTIIDTNSMVHTKARSSPYPGTDIYRFDVSTENVQWDTTLPGYKPPRYTSKDVLESLDWPDKDISKKDIFTWNAYDEKTGIDRSSHMGVYKVENGYPINPAGRTGLVSRGNLGRWGPNHAADAIITRWKHNEKGEAEIRDGLPVLEFVAVKRRDNRYWSLPGVFVLAREEFSTTVQRAFVVKALGTLMENADLATTMEPKLRRIFQDGQEVYTGYVDDARNTDNAWVETKAVNYHDEDGSITKGITLMAGRRQEAAAWLTVWPKIPMHSNHSFILEKVASRHGAAF